MVDDHFTVHCQCNRRLRIPDARAWKKVRCPSCETIFTADPGDVIPLPDDEVFPDEGNRCISCGEPLTPGDFLCLQCGRVQEAAEESPAPAPAEQLQPKSPAPGDISVKSRLARNRLGLAALGIAILGWLLWLVLGELPVAVAGVVIVSMSVTGILWSFGWPAGRERWTPVVGIALGAALLITASSVAGRRRAVHQIAGGPPPSSISSHAGSVAPDTLIGDAASFARPSQVTEPASQDPATAMAMADLPTEAPTPTDTQEPPLVSTATLEPTSVPSATPSVREAAHPMPSPSPNRVTRPVATAETSQTRGAIVAYVQILSRMSQAVERIESPEQVQATWAKLSRVADKQDLDDMDKEVSQIIGATSGPTRETATLLHDAIRKAKGLWVDLRRVERAAEANREVADQGFAPGVPYMDPGSVPGSVLAPQARRRSSPGVEMPRMKPQDHRTKGSGAAGGRAKEREERADAITRAIKQYNDQARQFRAAVSQVRKRIDTASSQPY